MKVSGVASSLTFRYCGRDSFSVREMDRFVQILRELLPPVDGKTSTKIKPVLLGVENEDGVMVDTSGKSVLVDASGWPIPAGAPSETGENGKPVIAEEPSNTKLQPDLKQGPGRGNWICNAFKRLF